MKNGTVRIESIEIKNFKNVRYGKLSFKNTRKLYNSSVLGLYGQNGSGKTAVIDALFILKYALTMQQIPASFADYINVDAEYATLKYEFKVINRINSAEYTVFYEVNIRKDSSEMQSAEYANDTVEKYKVTLFDEVLSYSYKCGDTKTNLQPVIDSRTNSAFVPTTKYNALVGRAKETETNLLVAKKYAAETSRSFVFSKELLNSVRKNCKEEYHLFLLEKMFWFGAYELFIINTTNSGLITMNALPLVFRYEEKNMASAGSLMINLNKPTTVPEDAFHIVEKVVENMNIVLAEIIPGLTISAKNLGAELLKNGDKGCRIQMVSNKNSKEIPLQYESEGVKKIISILQLLIVVYNKPSITVAIDELDSGVFEYLLGEILRIISEKGKGQLIFTSHNLRPLETIDRGFVAFTTTNPDNRYIRLNNVKTNNNLRDFYYRDIVLGEQSESVYEATNNYEIALAFREAGELSGS